MNNQYLKLFSKLRTTSGWTLLELILASMLTVVVVGGAGYGLVAVLNNNKIANARSETQHLLNLGVEFVSNEVKSANEIDQSFDFTNINATNITAADPYKEFLQQYSSRIASGQIKPVISLKVDGVSERIVYYIHDKSKETTKTPWAGPLVLYRFGPYIDDSTGSYINPTDPSAWGSGIALIDLLDNDIPADQKRCKNPTWQRLPVADQDPTSNTDASDSQIKGFFICVRGSKDMAELHAFTKVILPAAKTPISYSVDTKAFTRAATSSVNASSTAFLNLSTMALGGSPGPIGVSGTTIYTPPDCPETGQAIEMYSTKNPIGSVYPDAGIPVSEGLTDVPGSTVTLMTNTNGNGTCNYVYSSTTSAGVGNTPRSIKLKNGDELTVNTNPGKINQKDVDFITNILKMNNPSYIDSSGKIRLEPNQAIILLESVNSNVSGTMTMPDGTKLNPDPINFDDAIILLTLSIAR